ncbi:unnamed protein product [Boreogadus saida]
MIPSASSEPYRTDRGVTRRRGVAAVVFLAQNTQFRSPPPHPCFLTLGISTSSPLETQSQPQPEQRAAGARFCVSW